MKLLKNNIDLIIVFVVVVFMKLPHIFNYCKLYIPFAFDTQALFTWDYAAVLGLFPYKDIFYPYGMLYFYRNTNFYFHLIHFLLTPILLVSVFYILKVLWGNKKIYYSLFITFYLFVMTHTSEDAFVGYGVFVVFSAFLGIFFYKHYEEKNWCVFLIGIFLGIVFSLIHSQGTYMMGMFVLSLFLFPLLRDGFLTLFRSKYYQFRVANVVSLAGGVLLGLLPFLGILFIHNSLNDFFTFFLNLQNITQYGKSPFFPYSKTPDNIFTFVIIISTIFHLSYIYFYKSRKFELSNYLEIGIVLSILLMEQINIIRSIDWIITFASFFLMFILFYDLRNLLKTAGVKQEQIFLFLSLIIFSVFFLFGLHADKNILKTESTNLTQCVDLNISEFYNTHPDHFLVKTELTKEMKNDERIFSFPSDPIFYILFSQTPPYYGNVYDSSSEYAQNKQIDYLKDKRTKFVIYNTTILSTQDGVPDYARVPYEFQYILNSFITNKKIGDFLILKRMKTQDFFDLKHSKDIQDLVFYLTHIDLAHIPRSEGIYKEAVLLGSKLYIDFSNINTLNSYLGQNQISSKNKLLIIKQKTKRDATMTIKTKDNLKTEISFKKCGDKNVCVIDLDVIPLFYKERVIESLTLIPQDAQVKILEKPLKSNLW